MKAWNVYNKFNEELGCEIVYAETGQEAKENANIGSMSNGVDELRANRAKYADDKEHYTKEETMRLLLLNDWVFNDYPLYDGETYLGSIVLNRKDEFGINKLGLEKYTRQKLRLKKMRRTEFDDIILAHLPEGYAWLARNRDGTIYIFKGSKPFKEVKDGIWVTVDPLINKDKLLLVNVFPFLKWEDEPWQFRDIEE